MNYYYKYQPGILQNLPFIWGPNQKVQLSISNEKYMSLEFWCGWESDWEELSGDFLQSLSSFQNCLGISQHCEFLDGSFGCLPILTVGQIIKPRQIASSVNPWTLLPSTSSLSHRDIGFILNHVRWGSSRTTRDHLGAKEPTYASPPGPGCATVCKLHVVQN